MAKCVRVAGQGVPTRMSDDDAFQVVDRDRDGEYCSKTVYKEWYKDKEQLRSKLVGSSIVKVESLARCLQHAKGGYQ
jgi:hypothetical protein